VGGGLINSRKPGQGEGSSGGGSSGGRGGGRSREGPSGSSSDSSYLHISIFSNS